MAFKTPAQVAFQLAFQISPIIMTGGIAALIPGGMLPILSLASALNFPLGLLDPGNLDDLDQALFQFKPLQGGTLIEQKIGMYPFANQSVAANAVIREPLQISMLMIVNANPTGGGYLTKLMLITVMQAAFAQHNNSGGTYTIATPSFLYTDCVMTSMRDVSRQDLQQPQNAYQIDFIQPLISLQAASNAQAQLNSTMAQIGAGVPSTGAQSGLTQTIANPSTLATPSIAPAASNLTGSTVSGSSSGLTTSLSVVQ